MFGFGLTELLVILAILLLLFGTRKLKNVGSDLGGAIKGFRRAMNDDDKPSADEGKNAYIEGEARREEAEPPKAKSGVGDESKH